MTSRRQRFAFALGLATIAVIGTLSLYRAPITSWPPWLQALYAFLLIVGALTACILLFQGLGLLDHASINQAIITDHRHLVRGSFIGLVLAYWFLSIGEYAYFSQQVTLDHWRLLFLLVGTPYLLAGTMRPRWLYDRLRHSGAHQLLADTPTARYVFLTLGGLLIVGGLTCRTPQWLK